MNLHSSTGGVDTGLKQAFICMETWLTLCGKLACVPASGGRQTERRPVPVYVCEGQSRSRMSRWPG